MAFLAPSKHIGVIGVGAMGSAFVSQLVAQGFRVNVYDPSVEACARAAAEGATVSPNALGVFTAQNNTPVIVCVSSPKALATTVDAAVTAATGTRGTRITLGPVIETSTLALPVKEEARVRLARAGAVLLDCPVSGTSAQCRRGDLSILASGPADTLALCAHILNALAPGKEKVQQVGTFGMGIRLKLLANHLTALHSAAAAECVMLARASGLDPALAVDVLTKTAGTSRMLEVRGPLMVKHDYVPATGSIDIIVKDGGMIKDMALAAGCTLPLFDNVDKLYRAAQADGIGAHDIAGIHEYLWEKTRL